MGEAEHKLFFNFSLHTYLTKIAVTLLGAAIMILSARVLGPAGKGMLTLLVMIPVLATALFHLGIGQATVFFAPRVSRPSLVATSIGMIALIGFLATFLAMPVVLSLRHRVLRGIPAGWLIFMCAMIPIVLLYDLLTALTQALYRIKQRNLLNVAFPSFNLLLFLLLVVNWKMSVKGGMIAWSLAFALTVVIGIGQLLALTGPARFHFDPTLGRSLLGYGGRSYVGSLLNMLNARFDFFLVSLYLNPAEVGLYAVAVYLAELLWKLPESIAVVLQPRVAQLSKEEASCFTPRVLRLLMPLLLLLALAIALFSGILVRILFGKSFGSSGPVLLILLPGFLAYSLCKILFSDLLGRGHPLAYSVASLLTFVSMLILDILLIPRLGIRGAALASTIAYFLAALAMITIYLRVSAIPLSVLFFPGAGERGTLQDTVSVVRLLLPGKRTGRSRTDRDPTEGILP